MKLMHFSKSPLEELRQIKSYWPDKPNGLWVSDESDPTSWSDFCCETGIELGEYAYEVDLDMDRILHLATEEELLGFTRRWGEVDPRYVAAGARLRGWPATVTSVRWCDLHSLHDGILITPYHWRLRRVNWYYTWDCASGVVWNPRAVTGVRSVVL